MTKYAIRVTGLGNVHALFLPSAHSDGEAREHVAIGNASDPRQRVVALYRIRCLIDESMGDDSRPEPIETGQPGEFTYIQTGSVDKEPNDFFFIANTYTEAISLALDSGWTKIRLYQAEEIPWR